MTGWSKIEWKKVAKLTTSEAKLEKNVPPIFHLKDFQQKQAQQHKTTIPANNFFIAAEA